MGDWSRSFDRMVIGYGVAEDVVWGAASPDFGVGRREMLGA